MMMRKSLRVAPVQRLVRRRPLVVCNLDEMFATYLNAIWRIENRRSIYCVCFAGNDPERERQLGLAVFVVASRESPAPGCFDGTFPQQITTANYARGRDVAVSIDGDPHNNIAT